MKANLDLIKNEKLWYDEDPSVSSPLAQAAIDLVSAGPAHVQSVCAALTTALARGSNDKDASLLIVDDVVRKSRVELKADCRAMLQFERYQGADVVVLEPKEAAFVQELLKHHPRGLEKIKGCQAIAVGTHPRFSTRCFFVVRRSGQEDFSYVRCVDNWPSRENACQDRICEVICAVLQLHPSACEAVAHLLEEKFPNIRVPSITVEKHRNWVRSLLTLSMRMPVLAEFLLVLLVRRLLELDVEIQKLEDNDGQLLKPETEIDRMAQILDALMMLLFEYLQRRLSGVVGEQENRLVSTFVGIFSSTVLLTHRSRVVQFLFFYIASLRPGWAEAFLSCLLHTAYEPQQAMGKRHIALTYLSGFAARALFLPTKYCFKTTQYLCALALETLPIAENLLAAGKADSAQFRLFVLAAQGVCYILCFQAAAFASETVSEGPCAGETMLAALFPASGACVGNTECFTPILESSIGVISRINPSVAAVFCRSLAAHCPSLAQAQKRSLRESERNGASELSGGMYYKSPDSGGSFESLSIFPFDPYLLRHSHMFLMGLYRDWGPSQDGEDSAEESATEEDSASRPERRTNLDLNCRNASLMSAEPCAEAHSEADFTDITDSARRGFVPSVGPSPAFKPRCFSDAMSPDLTPLCMPMDSDDADDFDSFSLPLPSVDLPQRDGNSILSAMLNSSAYT